MSGNPHLYLLAKTMRSRGLSPTALAVRGGHFHKPDPRTWKPYTHTRLVQLEDINTMLYHDFSPEFHMHLHSPWVQNAKQGVTLVFLYFCLVLAPCWALGAYLHKKAGSQLFPALRPGKDHAHMGPRLIAHLKENNYENN